MPAPTPADDDLDREHSITYWHCERCDKSGAIEHDAHADVWTVYTLLMDAHYAAHSDCEETYYIRVSKEPITLAATATEHGAPRAGE
jgi:hypothetical protein